MKLKKYILCGVVAAGLSTFAGCDDVLFRDAPVDQISDAEIWKNAMLLDEYVLPWYRNMNHGFSTYVPTTIALVKSMSRYYMPWFGDQIVPSKTDYYNAGYGDLLKANQQEITNWAEVNWQTYYTQIQSINRLLENQGEIAAGEQKQRLLGEAHFFRAYYYFLLWRLHGGVMLIHELFDPLNDGTTYPRASYTEMVQAIREDAWTAAGLLPQEYDNTEAGRITKGAALMLIAKTYQWASSERFQNQAKPYLGFTDDRSHEMLDSARVAYERLMGLEQYELIQISGTTEEDFKLKMRSSRSTATSSSPRTARSPSSKCSTPMTATTTRASVTSWTAMPPHPTSPAPRRPTRPRRTTLTSTACGRATPTMPGILTWGATGASTPTCSMMVPSTTAT